MITGSQRVLANPLWTWVSGRSADRRQVSAGGSRQDRISLQGGERRWQGATRLAKVV